MLKIDFRDESFKNLLVLNHKANSLDICYVASSSGSLPVCLDYVPGAKNVSTPGVTCFT